MSRLAGDRNNSLNRPTSIRGAGDTYFDRMAWVGVGVCAPVILGALKVNALRGTCISKPLNLASSGLADRGPATIPNPVSTNACPLDPALDPSRGISFRAWKFLGLLPRTTIGEVMYSLRTILFPFVKVATILRCRMKCCCSSFLLPLFAVAL